MLVFTTFSESLARDLRKAAGKNSIDEVISLLDKGADPNHPLYWSEEEEEWPPLLNACLKRNLVMVKVLVQRGADVNKGGEEQNWTPLHVACAVGFKEGVDYLITEAGCKVGKLTCLLTCNYSLKLISSQTLTICSTIK